MQNEKLMTLTAKKSSYTNKTLPQLLLLAQKHFNAYIRKRDSKGEYFICISCGQYKSSSTMHAGHYLSAGHHSYLRFNETNVHGQCPACNTHLHGNLINYRINLVKKIGIDEVERMESIRNTSHKWDKFDVISVIEEYKGLAKSV